MAAPYRWVAGLNFGTTKVIVEVETTDGVIGLGEASNWRYAALINDELAPRLVGEDPDDLQRCWSNAVPPLETLHNTEGTDVLRAYGAIEMALWDVRAKIAEMPLFQLLGGASRKRVPFTEYFAPRERSGAAGGEVTPEDLGAYCARMVDEYGSTHFEGKVGYANVETDIATARCVREAIGPDRTLRLDANMGWRLPTARLTLQRIAAYDVIGIEDPVSTVEDMSRLREHTAVAFSTHVPDLRAAVRLGVPDSFVLNLTALGGIARTRRFIAACEAFGVGFSFYSGESGVGVAAYLHVAAAEPYLATPSQSLLRWYANDVIVGGPFQPVEGYLEVPDGLGLGVELDRNALQAAHQLFVDDGPIESAAVDPLVGAFRHPPLY